MKLFHRIETSLASKLFFRKLLEKKKKERSRFKKKSAVKTRTSNYLYSSKRSKKGIILKKISFDNIIYPFSVDIKLITEFLKKK